MVPGGLPLEIPATGQPTVWYAQRQTEDMQQEDPVQVGIRMFSPYDDALRGWRWTHPNSRFCE